MTHAAAKNVLGGKFLKTNAAATNATMNAIAAIVAKDATGGNSGQTDAAFLTTNVINATAVINPVQPVVQLNN